MNSFSQKSTDHSTTDSIVKLPKKVAIEIVKDIIRKDSCEEQLKIVKQNNELLSNNISSKDSVIAIKNIEIDLHVQKEKNLESVIQLKDLQKENLNKISDVLKIELKKTKKKLLKTKAAAGTIILFLSYVILK